MGTQLSTSKKREEIQSAGGHKGITLNERNPNTFAPLGTPAAYVNLGFLEAVKLLIKPNFTKRRDVTEKVVKVQAKEPDATITGTLMQADLDTLNIAFLSTDQAYIGYIHIRDSGGKRLEGFFVATLLNQLDLDIPGFTPPFELQLLPNDTAISITSGEMTSLGALATAAVIPVQQSIVFTATALS